MTTHSTTMAAPEMPIKLRPKRRAKPCHGSSGRGSGRAAASADGRTASTSVADAGVEPAIHQVHRQVHQAEDQSDEQHAALDDGVVAVVDAVEQKATHPR